VDENLDRPEPSSSADVTLVARGLTVTASVEASSAEVVVVRPGGDGATWKADIVRLQDRVELYWIGGQEERTLPGTVSEIEAGEDPLWHIAVSGPAERSQRRRSVRARVGVPVFIPWADGQLTGNTVDLSEGGMRALVDGWGVPLDPGTPSRVTLTLDETSVELRGEIVWTSIRGPQWLLAMKFLDVPENVADRIRRLVFQALRDERAAAAD
jgi:hypothetical protein